MKTTLKKYGANSQAVVIPKAILELFNFSSSTKATFEPRGDELVIHIKNEKAVKIEKAASKILKKHKNLYQSLANK